MTVLLCDAVLESCCSEYAIDSCCVTGTNDKPSTTCDPPGGDVVVHEVVTGMSNGPDDPDERTTHTVENHVRNVNLDGVKPSTESSECKPVQSYGKVPHCLYFDW